MTKLGLMALLNLLIINALAQTGTVVLNVQSIKASKGGEISAGIFKAANFPKVGKQFIGTEKTVTASQMQIVFNKCANW